jgi:hypothetical protein
MLQEHNRYLIYQLLGRSVEIRIPARYGGRRLKGIVEKVCRDIFQNEVQVTISGESHTFREPSAIIPDGSDIHFLYGDVELTDEGSMVPRYNAYDESLHEHLRRTARRPVAKMVFKLGDVEKTPRTRWRSRVAV